VKPGSPNSNGESPRGPDGELLRYVIRAKLWEISLVTFAADAAAKITAVQLVGDEGVQVVQRKLMQSEIKRKRAERTIAISSSPSSDAKSGSSRPRRRSLGGDGDNHGSGSRPGDRLEPGPRERTPGGSMRSWVI